MTKKLYNLMDWAEIEAVTYAEEDHPKAVLGPHPVRGGQTLIGVYRPGASSVSLKVKGMKAPVKMELADADGYFAQLVKNKEPFEYEVVATDAEGESVSFKDPYSFPESITKREIQKFESGLHYRAYELLGSHPMKIAGCEGVRFAVWAPGALRVSVVGDFNNWDGRVHQMERLFDSGVFELFIPDLEAGAKYKYEIKLKSGVSFMKADPYALSREDKEDGASIVYDINTLASSDDDWSEVRESKQSDKAPIAVYDAGICDLTRASADKLIKKANDYGYTHIAVQAPSSLLYMPLTDPKGVLEFTDRLHRAEVGVLLSLNCGSFDLHTSDLGTFDGTALYEDGDDKRAYVPGEDRRYFNLGRNEVKSYLMANMIYVLDVFRFDGIVIKDVARMLYLDYGKQESGWTPNMYGGNENLDAIDFFKQMNSVLHKYSSDILVISDDDTAFFGVTSPVNEDGLGFDYKLDHGWSRDVLGYLRYDPLSRSGHYNEICFPMLYQYNERFILPLSGIVDIWEQMPGDRDEKFGNLRALLSFFILYPGKKYLCDADFEGKGKDVQGVRDLFKDLVSFYKRNQTLFSKELLPEGFSWINNISARENIIVFSRSGSKKDDSFVVVANFENVPRKDYKIGVPAAGKYTEALCSDNEKYDGFGFVNKNPIMSKKDECDGRDNSIRIKVAPLGVSVFKYSPTKE